MLHNLNESEVIVLEFIVVLKTTDILESIPTPFFALLGVLDETSEAANRGEKLSRIIKLSVRAKNDFL